MLADLERETEETTEREDFQGFIHEAKLFKEDLKSFRAKMFELREFADDYGAKFK